ncbi:hypothetical protein R6Q59_018870 [Mikania micrantha]
MKSKKLGYLLLLLLCAQFISSLAFESQEDKASINMNRSSNGDEDGVKPYGLVFSKTGKGKGTYGGQNNRTPNTNKSSATSMLIKQHGYMSNIFVCVIITNIIQGFYF